MIDRDFYAALRRAGKLSGTIKSCLQKREARFSANPPGQVCHGRFAGLAAMRRQARSRETVVPLGAAAEHYLSTVRRGFPQLREWSLGAEAVVQPSCYSIHESGSNSNWGKRSTFQRGVRIQSYATCTDFSVCVFRIYGEMRTIPAPRGWRWDIDANGLRMRLCSDSRIDYHPTAHELLGDVAELPKKAKNAAAQRIAQRRRAKADAAAVRHAEEVGVYVCLADSLRAGNCRAGSETFARRHGLDPSQHYRPAEVLAMANGDTRGVALACTQAVRRTIRELAQGYSVLAEHRV